MMKENRSPGKSFLIALPMMVLTFVMMSGGRIPSDPQRLFVFAVTYLFFNLLFFLMIHRGNTDPYRAIAFITYALLFLDTITGKGSLMPYDASVIAVQTLVKVKGGWVARIHLRKIS